jgi:hypothetical protein
MKYFLGGVALAPWFILLLQAPLSTTTVVMGIFGIALLIQKRERV